MILVSLFISSLSAIHEKYTNLSQSALAKSHLKQIKNDDNKVFFPGRYQYERISFEVKNAFLTTNHRDIDSYAIDQELEAIALVLKDKLKTSRIISYGNFISDPETSKIYQIGQKIGNNEEVILYQIQPADLFSILSNIKVTYSSTTTLSDDISSNNTYYSIGYPKNYSYEELKKSHTNFIPFTISSQNSTDENVSFEAKIGGYTIFSSSYEFTFQSLEEFYSKINFLGEAKMESGFRFTNSSANINNLQISMTDLHPNESKKLILNQFSFEIFGIQLSIDFYLNFELHIDDISFNSTQNFDITSTSFVTFNKEYEYSTSENEKIATKTNSFNFNIDYNMLSASNYEEMEMLFKPTIDVSVSADINFSMIGNEPSRTTINTGVRNKYDVSINHNEAEKNYCLYPYLSYSFIPYLYHIFLVSDEVNLNSVTVINKKDLNSQTFWVGEKIGPRCLYGCYNVDTNTTYDLPVFYSNEINNTNTTKMNIEFFVDNSNSKLAEVDINEDININILKRINSENDNLTFKGFCYDPYFSNSLLLSFYPIKFQSNLYDKNQSTELTDFYHFNSNLFFTFFHGFELHFFNEVHANNSYKFAFLESEYNVTLILHTKNKYLLKKMMIYDDQFSIEESYSYYKKNNWRIKITKLTELSMKIRIMLINSTSKLTEKSFYYDENIVFNMDNRKLGLQIEFEKGDTKFIMIDLNNYHQNKFTIIEELYFNNRIEITLIPYSPFVFFDLDQESITNETGLIASPIFDSEKVYSFNENNEIQSEIDQSIKTWKYLVYHLKTDLPEDSINERLFIFLSSNGFYPLNSKDEFAGEIYLLEFTEFTFEDGFLTFYIPFIRNREFKEGDKIVILAIFNQPLINDAFCPNSFHYTQFNSKIATGCIENNINFESPLVLTAIDQTGRQYNPIQKLFEQDAFVYANLFNPKIDSLCLVARIPNVFPVDSLTLSIDNLLVDALLSFSFDSIKVKCERCSGIFRNGETYQSNDIHEIEIKIIERIYSGFYAICSTNDDKFCIQKLTLNPDKVTLINRPLISNFTSLNFLENLPEIIIPKAQLFASYGTNLLIYSKDTKVGLSIASELNPQIDLLLKAETRGEYVRLYTMTTSNEFFPFSSVSIYSSLRESLDQLGLNTNDLSLYKVRDEIFIKRIDALLTLPKNPSSELLYGLSSTVIRSINCDYQISSLTPQPTGSYTCFCFVTTLSQDCHESEYTDYRDYIKITPHEYNNVDVYWPDNINFRAIVFLFEGDVRDFYPNLTFYPANIWKLFFTSSFDVKIYGAIAIPQGQRLDSINRIDCSGLDVSVDMNLQDKRYGHLDFSSSPSNVNVNVNILNEINYRLNNITSYYSRNDIIANAHYLQSWKLSKTSKKVSTRSEYFYNIVDINTNKGDDTRGHYQFTLACRKNGYQLNDNFCSSDSGGHGCMENTIPIGTLTIHSISDIIQSYPDKINHISIDILDTSHNIYSDCFYKLSSKHQNVLMTIFSSASAVLKPTLIIYQNLNISFEDNLDLSQLTLQQQVKIGSQRNISLNNKRVQKVEVTAFCPDKEINFDRKQIIIKDFNSANTYSFGGISCTLPHSTITVSLGTDSDLYAIINQQFNSYPNEYCLFAYSPDECQSTIGLQVRNNDFNIDFIRSGNQVTVTITNNYETSLNLQGKSVIFKGINNKVKLFGSLTVSSDSAVIFESIDISDLNVIFLFDIRNNEIASLDFTHCDTLPNTFQCKLINPNSNQLTKKFADLSLIENISSKWIPFETSHENIIISTELVIEEKSASIKLNHITPSKVFCYFASDSSNCPSIATIVNPSDRWQDYNDSLIYFSDYFEISDVEINDKIVYFAGSHGIGGKLIFSGSTICHFIDRQLSVTLSIETQIDFDQKKSPCIIFGDHESQPQSWNLIINGYDVTRSFCLFENAFFYPNEIIGNENSDIIIEKKGFNTEIHFTQLYEPNHFCIYDYPYESLCLIEYHQYMPIKSSELWDIKLNSKDMPKFIFASKSQSMFLPLKRFQKESIQTASIEVLSFSTFPIFLVPEGFTLIINGDLSKIAAKLSINTSSLEYGNIVFDEISQIQLIPTDKTVIYDDEKIMLLNEDNYLTIFYEVQMNSFYNRNEVVVRFESKEYEYNSESIDDLYLDESTGIKTLKLTKETTIDLSKLKIKKLGIFGSNYNLSLTNTNPSLTSLFINSSNVIFDSFHTFEVGLFNSNVNNYPFSSRAQLSPEISLKYRQSLNVADGASIKINKDTFTMNDEEFSFDENQFDLYVNDFCSIDVVEKTIDIYGDKSIVNFESSNSNISFNEFDVLCITSKSDISNISFHNISLIDLKSQVKTDIAKYTQEKSSGNLVTKKAPMNINIIDLYGKPFYCESANVASLNAFNGKSLVKGVNVNDFLCINSNASLVAHSSAFLPTHSIYFHISTVSPLLVLVNSTFDCSSLIINFDYSYQSEEFVLIKGLESIDQCDNIKDKADKLRYKINYDLSCRMNENDETIELIAGNCTVFSKEFTESNKFTESNGFSISDKFTNSIAFSKTLEFSFTFQFTMSNDFSDSRIFSMSSTFAQSIQFSNSESFTNSDDFTMTKEFSMTSQFSVSSDFSESKDFTHSTDFIPSNIFSKSKDFSKTSLFSFSSSFSSSNDFSNSNIFTKSNEFSSSDYFMSNNFSNSHFFTNSEEFTKSLTFSISSSFTSSQSFGQIQTVMNPYLTYSLTLSLSFMSYRSVIFSYSNSFTLSIFQCLDQNGLTSNCETQIVIYRYLPYIIYTHRTAYTAVYLPFEIRPRKRGLTKEQLIGISCVSAALFFLIVGIMIMILNKRNSQKNYNDYLFSDDETVGLKETSTSILKTKDIINDDDDEQDLDFWL